jgi:hypothetical protein
MPDTLPLKRALLWTGIGLGLLILSSLTVLLLLFNFTPPKHNMIARPEGGCYWQCSLLIKCCSMFNLPKRIWKSDDEESRNWF